MASTRKSRPVDADAVEAALGAAIARLRGSADPTRPLHAAVALSGGRDSMVLLHALARLRFTLALEPSAIHVHHGLAPEADAWAAFCARECASRTVPLAITRVRIERRGGESLEAAAREARYVVLRAVDADALLLAHHADDQAETVLLQLMRGAGAHGLAAMPEQQRGGDGPLLLRPFLSLSRSAIEGYARLHDIRWIDDPSNDDTALRRNALRHGVVPTLRATFPGYPATVTRAALHQAEAARLLDDLAALDAARMLTEHPRFGPALDRPALVALAGTRPDRARNVLRWFLRLHALRPASTARLAALLEQCTSARNGARVRLLHGDALVESEHGRIIVRAVATRTRAATQPRPTRPARGDAQAGYSTAPTPDGA